MNNNICITEQVSKILKDNGHETALKMLQNELVKLHSSDFSEIENASTAIENMCNIKWLGDLYIEGLSIGDWGKKLNHLRLYVKKKVKTIKDNK